MFIIPYIASFLFRNEMCYFCCNFVMLLYINLSNFVSPVFVNGILSIENIIYSVYFCKYKV